MCSLLCSVTGSSFSYSSSPNLPNCFSPRESALVLVFAHSISDEFNKSRPGSRMILTTIDFLKAFDFVWCPTLFHKLILASLPLCFARWTQSFFCDRCAYMVYQSHKIRFFKSVEVFCKDPSLALYFSLFSSMISLLLCFLSPAALFMLTIWQFGPPPPRSLLQWRPYKEL